VKRVDAAAASFLHKLLPHVPANQLSEPVTSWRVVVPRTHGARGAPAARVSPVVAENTARAAAPDFWRLVDFPERVGYQTLGGASKPAGTVGGVEDLVPNAGLGVLAAFQVVRG
jgi:hypothetical protein